MIIQDLDTRVQTGDIRIDEMDIVLDSMEKSFIESKVEIKQRYQSFINNTQNIQKQIKQETSQEIGKLATNQTQKEESRITSR
jgi:CHASE1-domain containing sensor protein